MVRPCVVELPVEHRGGQLNGKTLYLTFGGIPHDLRTRANCIGADPARSKRKCRSNPAQIPTTIRVRANISSMLGTTVFTR